VAGVPAVTAPQLAGDAFAVLAAVGCILVP
jgi:hypothetical protein